MRWKFGGRGTTDSFRPEFVRDAPFIVGTRGGKIGVTLPTLEALTGSIRSIRAFFGFLLDPVTSAGWLEGGALSDVCFLFFFSGLGVSTNTGPLGFLALCCDDGRAGA